MQGGAAKPFSIVVEFPTAIVRGEGLSVKSQAAIDRFSRDPAQHKTLTVRKVGKGGWLSRRAAL